MRFWAHSDRTGLPLDDPAANWQLLNEHLVNVTAIARSLAKMAAPQDAHFHDLAEWCGLLHDFGKYSDCFQRMILTQKGRCQHAIHGAAAAYYAPQDGPGGMYPIPLAMAVAGHHAGMPDLKGENGKTSLSGRLKESQQEARSLVERATRDCAELKKLLANRFPALQRIGTLQFDLFTRMLFSCLVDADRLDTAGRSNAQLPLNAERRLAKLLAYLQDLSATTQNEIVKNARREVLDDCLWAAEFPERLLSLSVPTGGGKTLAAMAFALRRAALEPGRYRHIIVVIPYLSIIEQNAEVYAKVFGNDAVLEHHSGSFERLRANRSRKTGHEYFEPAEKVEDDYENPLLRPETENWDSPFIVTTSVRFFESLFSNKPSDLRRVHNIARSIIILDEVQVLPRDLLSPLLRVIRDLSTNWGCSFVLSTATQPAFEKQDTTDSRDRRWMRGTLREIVRAPGALHKQLKRVAIDWRIDVSVDWPEVARWLARHPQALCVVNLKDHAGQLFDLLAAEMEAGGAKGDSLFHLSTRMCAAHRLATIETIRERLKQKLPCLVVSTQLIEAGVDLDFPVAYRALGPLDSIIQAAGRVNREGMLSDGGKLVVFKPVDGRTPPGAYEQATGITNSMAASSAIQGDDLEAVKAFFERYYTEGDQGVKFEDMQNKAEFRTIADNFEMISSRTQDVFVPYGEGKRLTDELREAGRLDKDLRRRLQRYTVGLQPWEFREAQKTVLTELRAESDIWIASELAYRADKGLQLTISPEACVI